jgi:secondary thiamine-phosphate synthase enzyme
MIRTEHIELRTAGNCDVIDITDRVEGIVHQTGLQAGLVTVFVPGSTAALTTIEYEPGLVQDIKEMFGRLIPSNRTYQHDARWGDDNGHAHVRAALLGPSLTIPLEAGRLTLGAWQQIVLIDMDNRPRARDLIVQIMGE